MLTLKVCSLQLVNAAFKLLSGSAVHVPDSSSYHDSKEKDIQYSLSIQSLAVAGNRSLEGSAAGGLLQ